MSRVPLPTLTCKLCQSAATGLVLGVGGCNSPGQGIQPMRTCSRKLRDDRSNFHFSPLSALICRASPASSVNQQPPALRSELEAAIRAVSESNHCARARASFGTIRATFIFHPIVSRAPSPTVTCKLRQSAATGLALGVGGSNLPGQRNQPVRTRSRKFWDDPSNFHFSPHSEQGTVADPHL